MRYNPPPNWPPPPPGWAPPPGWQPDPAWGHPPPGWPLWVPDNAARRNRAAWIFGGLTALVAAVVVGVVLVATLGSRSTDDEQIRAVVAGMEQAYNSGDAQAFQTFLCEAQRDDAPQDAQTLRILIDLTVDQISVDGSVATAEVTARASLMGQDAAETDSWSFVREAGRWKACDARF